MNDSWKEISKGSHKKRFKGKIELRNPYKNQITMINRYSALESECNISGDDISLETALVNKTKVMNTKQLGNKLYTEQECLARNKARDELDIRIREQPNLQKPTPPCQKLNLNYEQVTYSIPTIINGQISRKITIGKVHKRMQIKKGCCGVLPRRLKQWLIEIIKSS
jgi:hypothetical protein